ncbi:hypothetical protein DFH09DRAFT_1500224 [Mycena vulgaris]|nr:hypothetical protein DFH09DRAFT_1500224 [Mycena vulgaris]
MAGLRCARPALCGREGGQRPRWGCLKSSWGARRCRLAQGCGRRGWCGVGLYGHLIATRTALLGSPIKLSICIYVTCLCDPDTVPAIPGCVGVTEAWLHVDVMLPGLLGGGAADKEDDEDGGKHKSEASSASASVEALPAKATRVTKPLRTRRKMTGSGRTRAGAGWR